MKAFLISTLIFLLLVSAVLLNYFYINRTADKLDDIVSDISPGSDGMNQAISELEVFWKKNEAMLDLTVDHQLVNSMGVKIASIRLFADNSEDHLIEKELLLFKEDIKELRRLEKFSLGNIL